MANYVTLVIAISTCFIGVITSIIAYSQMKIASAKVKLDLYERRFNVYISALDFYRAFYKEEPQEVEKCMLELIRSCRESKFLFKEEDGIYEILTKIKKAGEQVVLSNDDTKKNNASLNLNNFYKSALHSPKVFEQNLYDLEEKIKPYIQFENVKGWTFF